MFKDDVHIYSAHILKCITPSKKEDFIANGECFCACTFCRQIRKLNPFFFFKGEHFALIEYLLPFSPASEEVDVLAQQANGKVMLLAAHLGHL